MTTCRVISVALILMLASGCNARELAWLVPRASVGFALHTHGGQVASAGFITLVAPLQRPARTGRPFVAPRSRGRLQLLGPSSPCRIAEACRWEGHARTGTMADLTEDEALERAGTP